MVITELVTIELPSSGVRNGALYMMFQIEHGLSLFRRSELIFLQSKMCDYSLFHENT